LTLRRTVCKAAATGIRNAAAARDRPPEGPMAELSIRGLAKTYAGGVRALAGVDLDIRSGEFFTLLGPSGCGKTTLLRAVAGFVRQDSGEIHVGGRRIDDLPAHRRDIGMVFQDYAVFPHLTVADNVAFGLRARRLPRERIAERVADALRMVHLAGLERRLPAELSGGQQQRIGLARAMAIHPTLLLMDEPLSNLDAKLRVELREDIRDIQRRLGITTVYVTHDQEEALAVSDRICVMNAGTVEQVATPHEAYARPRTRFAAGFVGTMNFLEAEIRADSTLVFAGGAARLAGAPAPGKVTLAIRPEHVAIADPGAAPPGALGVAGTVRKTTYLGREAHLVIDVAGMALAAEILDPTPAHLAMEGRAVVAVLPFARLAAFAPSGESAAVEFAP
jgi:ABC-type Fe3+/spermidine/putrescine transport system ATPase subunit